MSNHNSESHDEDADDDNFEALVALRSVQRYIEKRYEQLMQSHVQHHPHARLPEGKPEQIPRISADNAAELSAAGAPALDRVYLAGPDAKHSHIMVAITFENLAPNLKALLLILSEPGPTPSADGFPSWKSTDYIIEHLPPLKGDRRRKHGAVRQLIHRLRDDFARRGLDRMLIETQPGKARLRVRCGGDPTSPTSAGCDTPPSV